MAKKMKLFFVHDGKAPYPALPAYKSYFSRYFEVDEGDLESCVARSEPEERIFWYMMGFYPKRVGARMHIHDYRSLSVGEFSRIKDFVKKSLNFKPDLRIFQNLEIRDSLKFSDRTPSVFIPVGLSPELGKVANVALPDASDFSYVGMINKDRNLDLFLDSFLNRFGGSKTISMVGPSEDWILKRYSEHSNIKFHGKLPQIQAYAHVLASSVAVSYFPYKYPHSVQAPTKLLEYIELGKSLLVNDSPSNMRVLKEYGVPAIVRGADVFSDVPDPEAFPAISRPASNPLRWPDFIENSGVAEKIFGFVNR